MDPEYELELLTAKTPIPATKRSALHASLCVLGSQCLPEIPDYQVFEEPGGKDWLADKILVLARHHGILVGFVSARVIPIPGLDDPIIHTGLTMVHPSHRRSTGLNQTMFAQLFLHLLERFPKGVWTTTLAEVISSLVHMSKCGIDAFPSTERDEPTPIHLRIAREINRNRAKLLISPNAVFEEHTFVFRGSNDWPKGKVFMKDVDDRRYWHRDVHTSLFYRNMLRRNKGDEVLLVAFLEPTHIIRMATSEKHERDWGEKYSSLGVEGRSKL